MISEGSRRSHTTREFRKLFAQLPSHIRRQAREAYATFQNNPAHPGLRFKQVLRDPAIYSARVGIGYRALAALDEDALIWFWIGSHAEYDQLLRRL